MGSRSHPPSLTRRVERCLQGLSIEWRHAQLFVAVSGGPDSMALLEVLARLRERLGFELSAISLNHGLRAESAQEVELVGGFCHEKRVTFFSETLELVDGGNLQERAREARYRALWKIAQAKGGSEAYLATAHHKDDRAETVLMRILRGASLEGLSVLPPQSGRLLRPMIRASRWDVEQHVERHGIPFVTDPSNEKSRFLRVRVRRELLPLLRELGPGIAENLEQLADEAEQLDDALGLNREQRQQLRHALRNSASAVDLPLPGGLRLIRDRTRE